MNISLSIRDLGNVEYQSCWLKQRELQASLISGSNKEHYLFCEHLPVITYGGTTDLKSVLVPIESGLEHRKVELIKTDRGGNITYHGPGQLVFYLILDLKKRHQDVDWYLRTLEKIVIELLKQYDIHSNCIKGKTGVWTSEKDKICSIGVRFSRWCSMHGLAINLSKESESGFQRIIPCGLAGAEITSIEKITAKAPNKSEVIARLSELALARFYDDFKLNYQLI